MNKAEWDMMDEYEKNETVWSYFPDIALDSEDWVLSTDGGESGFSFFDTKEEADAALVDYKKRENLEEATVEHWRHYKEFTTDRNACALVLDEIEKRDLIDRFIDEVRKARDDLPLSPWIGMRTDPDTICYCALKAVENGR